MKHALTALALLFAGCAGLHQGGTEVLREAEIHRDAVWQGRILIEGSVKVFKGATLTIRPGTEVTFARRDRDRDGLGDGTLIVEGRLKALGTRREPIRFRSAAPEPQPGDWLEIRADRSPEIRLRFCDIRHSAYTLHAHFSKGVVENSTIRENIDGCRLGHSTFAIRHCLIEDNSGKGVNFRNSNVEVARNLLRRNRSGIFLFETDRASNIHHNNLYDNQHNLRLGDFFRGDLRVRDNWWGTADPEAARQTVYDRKRDATIGTVHMSPARSWIAGAGPEDALRFREAWRVETGGFVDAPAVAEGDTVFASAWDGRVYALDRLGKRLWVRDLGDVIDAAPALAADALYCQTWSREVHALSRRSGETRWRFTYPPSRSDDHRQGGLAKIADLVLVPAWNGTLYALEAETGLVRWSRRVGQPLRARPVWDGRKLYVASGAGVLSALDLSGNERWRVRFEEPLLAPPAVTPEGPVAVARDGTLAAFDAEGRERWRRELHEPCFYGGLIYADGALYLGTAAGALWKLDAQTGRRIWRVATSGPVYATPRLDNGRLFFGDNGGTFYAVSADTAAIVASRELPRELQGTPARLGKRLILGSRDRFIYALDIVDLPVSEP